MSLNKQERMELTRQACEIVKGMFTGRGTAEGANEALEKIFKKLVELVEKEIQAK